MKIIKPSMTKEIKADTQEDDYTLRAVWFCALTLPFGLNAATCRDVARHVSTCPVAAMSLWRRGAPRLYNIVEKIRQYRRRDAACRGKDSINNKK
jgi:hypothetical protein